MKRLPLWMIIGNIIVAVVLILGLVWGGMKLYHIDNDLTDANKQLKQKTATITYLKTTIAAYPAQSKVLTDKNIQLQFDNDRLQFGNDSLLATNNNLTIANDSLTLALNKCQSEAVSKKVVIAKKPIKKAVAKPVAKRQTVKPAAPVAVNVLIIERQAIERQAIESQTTASTTWTETVVTATDPLQYLRNGGNEILACCRTNGSKDQHFPAYAMDRGARFSNTRDNGLYGYNLVLTPVESISGTEPGVTKDGVFFAPVSYFKKYLNMSGEPLDYVDLLYKGNWGGSRMILQGEFFIFYSK